MRIIIIGAGKLGYSIAELLSKEEYDKIPEQRIKVIVDFPNLSEDARDAEKKKILYT